MEATLLIVHKIKAPANNNPVLGNLNFDRTVAGCVEPHPTSFRMQFYDKLPAGRVAGFVSTHGRALSYAVLGLPMRLLVVFSESWKSAGIHRRKSTELMSGRRRRHANRVAS